MENKKRLGKKRKSSHFHIRNFAFINFIRLQQRTPFENDC